MAFVIPTKYVGKTSYFHETFGDFPEKCVFLCITTHSVEITEIHSHIVLRKIPKLLDKELISRNIFR